ncbi:hypothetical protein [Xanthomonas sp. 3498]|uniref:hypothetical protein n=1 Tax=Xanthomonas sp. 3498 TaxID=2663863 RepID=UPI001618C88C|nr:hypothetical protein [Xanthomonas sp. 3498]MBB5876302.1 hypothetical protein [Xanthomonas sp. 3498]
MNVYPESVPAPNAELLSSPEQLAFEFAGLNHAAEPACAESASAESEQLSPMQINRRQVIGVLGRLYHLDVNCDQITGRVLSYRLSPLSTV